MLIEIPDDLARRAKAELEFSAYMYRQIAEDRERFGHYVDAARLLMLAAIAQADLPEPLVVGHLARWNDDEDDNEPSLVLAIDGPEAWIRRLSGRRTNAAIDRLTYAGPKPEGWGQW